MDLISSSSFDKIEAEKEKVYWGFSTLWLKVNIYDSQSQGTKLSGLDMMLLTQYRQVALEKYSFRCTV